MKNWIRKLFGSNCGSAAPATEFDTTPDYPVPFGYKTTWYAIKNTTPEDVIEKLKLHVVSEANWSCGIKCAYEMDCAFVSPQTNGYVLVVGLSVNSQNHEEVIEHGKLFDELQYFGTHRVVEYHAWARFVGGKLLRAYSYVGESGEILWNEGAITSEELELGFDIFPKTEDDLAETYDFPDETSVITIASAWGINPFFENVGYEKSTGYVCRWISKKKGHDSFVGLTNM